MRNYVVINGRSSKELIGLAINELPPISKPSLRTRVETIDGRDGDIITDLGYSAYDKTFTIGLFGEGYDINQVISFFNQEGTISFSNEEDKYYRFKMVNQIDFEKLLKFRTASVTVHVQPFKFSTVEFNKSYPITNSTCKVTNLGNYKSKPKFTITGSGTINLSLNGVQVMVINLGESSSTMIIDTEKMEAYNNSGILKNRDVTGSYNNLALNPGANTLTWTGTITQIKIERASRWL